MDEGGGTYGRVARSGVSLKDLDIVLLRHLHVDHAGDLSAVMKTVTVRDALKAIRGRFRESGLRHLYRSAGPTGPAPDH